MQVKQQFPVSSKNLFDATKGVLSSEQGIKFEVDNLIMRIEGNRKTTFMSFPFSFSISISEADSEKSLLVIETSTGRSGVAARMVTGGPLSALAGQKWDEKEEGNWARLLISKISKYIQEGKLGTENSNKFFCPYCGVKNLKGIEVCPKCKTSLTSIFEASEYECEDCGSNVPADAKYCPKCGTSLND